MVKKGLKSPLYGMGLIRMVNQVTISEHLEASLGV